MSTAVVERVAEQPKRAELVVVSAPPKARVEEDWDPHPLLPVFVAMAVSFALAVTFIGTILAWLALRHSGVMAP